jgi:hypothetical protein
LPVGQQILGRTLRHVPAARAVRAYLEDVAVASSSQAGEGDFAAARREDGLEIEGLARGAGEPALAAAIRADHENPVEMETE